MSLNSPWLYLLAGVSLILLLLLLFLVKKNKANPRSPKKAISEDSTSPKIVSVLQKSNTPVLLAASRLTDLPVTVPINLAVSLAQTGKCLLIDLDTKRDALAKVFEIDSTRIDRDLRIAPIETEFDNLSVWPAQYFNLLKQMNLASLLSTANNKYDHILIYAPYLTVLADRKQIASCAKQAILFHKDGDTKKQLQDLLKECNCKILLEA